MTSEALIRDRVKRSVNDDDREISYWLRLVVANYIDGDSGQRAPKQQNGRFGDVVNRTWEEGRYNPIANNTLVTAERQTFARPDFQWRGTRPTVGAVRKSYFFWLWEQSNLSRAYWLKFIDLITLGEANVGCFVRGDGVEPEWCDALNVGWDPAFKDPAKRRYVTYDLPLSLSIALKYYPALSKYKPLREDGQNAEEEVVIRQYWDRDERTEACYYNQNMIHGPTANRYDDMLPIRATTLAELPSLKKAMGIVERQLGSHEVALKMQRFFRDTALSSEPVGIASGFPNEEGLRELFDPEMPDRGYRVLRAPNPQAGFTWAKGPEIQQSSLEVYGMVKQDIQAESGENEFSMNQTTSNIDFASQLGYLAQQGGARGKYLAQQHEEGLRKDILHLIVPTAERWEARSMSLTINGVPVEFTPTEPINPLLGSDGELIMKPGGSLYRSSAQKMQEAMIFANLLTVAMNVPIGLQERVVRMVAEAAEIEEVDDWVNEFRAGQEQMMAQQNEMAQAQMEIEAMKATKGQKPQSEQQAAPIGV